MDGQGRQILFQSEQNKTKDKVQCIGAQNGCGACKIKLVLCEIADQKPPGLKRRNCRVYLSLPVGEITYSFGKDTETLEQLSLRKFGI